MTGRHSESKATEDSSNDETQDYDNRNGSSVLPFTMAQLESDSVRLAGRKQEVLYLRATVLDLLKSNNQLSLKNNEVRKTNGVLRRKLSDAMADNVKLQAVVMSLRKELESADLLDPMVTVQKLRSESKHLEESIRARKSKTLEDHNKTMNKLELDHKARKAEMDEELRELELLIDQERDRLADLQQRAKSLSGISSPESTTTSIQNLEAGDNDAKTNDHVTDSWSNSGSHDDIVNDAHDPVVDHQPIINPFTRKA